MSNDTIDVSVIIASARERTIERAVNSIHNDKTEYNYEILVGASGWYDNSLDANVVDIPKSYNSYMNRNKLIEKSRGDYIAILDDDDEWVNGRFDTQYKILDEKDADIVGTRVSSGSIPATMCVDHPSIMMNSDFRYREKFSLCGDWDLMLRAYDNNMDIRLSDKEWCNRDRSDSVSERRTELQNVFGAVARLFHFQRKLKGEDSYNKWNPPIVTYKDDTNVSDVEKSIEPISSLN